MKISKLLRTAFTLAVCAAMSLPHPAMASGQAARIIDGIKVSRDIKNVRLGEGGSLQGVIVDQQGNPAAGAPVMIGQQGKVIAQLDTAADGRYTLADMTPGVYQVVSYAGAETIRLYDRNAPADSVEGVVQVVDQAGIERGRLWTPGRFSGLRNVLQNPLLWITVIAAAIAIPLALDDSDGS